MRMVGAFGTFISVLVATTWLATTPAPAAPPEFSSPFPNAFASTSKSMTLETIGKDKVTCEASTDNGEVTGPTTVLVTIAFTGCSSGEGGGRASCQSRLVVPGEIVTERLSGALGYLNRKHTSVGLDLTNPTGGRMARFGCGEDTGFELLGSLIGRITPIDQVVEPGSHMILKFAQKEGHQTIKKLLGGPRNVPTAVFLIGPNPVGSEEAGISFTDLLTFGSPIQIIA